MSWFGEGKESEEREGKTLVTVEDGDPSLSFSGGSPFAWPASSDWKAWKTDDAQTIASGGTAAVSEKPGATVRFEFQGEQLSVDFIAHSRPSSATISIDGGEAKPIDIPAVGADAPNKAPSGQRLDPTRVVFGSLGCGAHSVVITNTSPAGASAKDSRLIFDAYNYVDPGDLPCASAPTGGTSRTISVATEPTPPNLPPKKANTSPSSSTRLAGYVVGGVVFLAFAMGLIAWIVRRFKKKGSNGFAKQKAERLPDQLSERRKRLSEVVARYQSAPRKHPSDDDSATGSRNFIIPVREASRYHDSTETVGKKGWIALDEGSMRSSLNRSSPPTPRDSPQIDYFGASPTHASTQRGRQSPLSPPPKYPSPVRSPAPRPLAAGQQRRVEFVTSHEGPSNAQEPSGPPKSILLKKSGQRPWTAPNAGAAALPAFGTTPSQTVSPASTRDGSMQAHTQTVGPRGMLKGASNPTLRRPNTASAVDHFSRGHRWVEIERPLSSIIARVDVGKAYNQNAPAKDEKEKEKDAEVILPLETGKSGSVVTTSELNDPHNPYPSRPPKSPLRSETDLGRVGVRPGGVWNGYAYNVAEEQAMWRNLPVPSGTDQNDGTALSRDVSPETATRIARLDPKRTEANGDSQSSSPVCSDTAGAENRNATDNDWITHLPMYRKRMQQGGDDHSKKVHDDAFEELLRETRYYDARSEAAHTVPEKGPSDSESTCTRYSRASWENESIVRSEAGTSRSDFATFRSDASAMDFIRPRGNHA